MKKRIIALGMSMLLVFNIGVQAKEDTSVSGLLLTSSKETASKQELSTQEAADYLNKINILKGDGNSYNLLGQLTRAEGATFIVRLLGEEEVVTHNKIDYVAMNFSDVLGSDWFSPYVGYCVQEGIINGYTDGTFRPQDTLSEQAFMKMVLTAMGYKYGRDFTWTDTLDFAYEKGILTDSNHDGMMSDSGLFSRGNVVDLLYHVIGLKNENMDKAMVDNLIDQGLLSFNQALEYGFIKDSLVMDVTAISVENEGEASITFNEVPVLSTDNITIKEKYSDDQLPISQVIQMDVARQLLVKMDKQVPDMEYVLTISGAKDLEGNVMDDYSYEFYGYRPSDFTSDYYRIEKAELVKSNQLDVTFSQPVNINSISTDDIDIYRVGVPFMNGTEDTMSLSLDHENPYLLHIEFLTFDFSFQESFEVVIDGSPKSLYGAKLLDGRGDRARFKSLDVEVEDFMLKDVLMEDANTIILRFNKNLRQVIAEQVYSYEIRNASDVALKILDAKLVDSGEYAGKAVRLTSDYSIAEGGTYGLMINQAYNTDRTESIIEAQSSFVAKMAQKPVINISHATMTDSDRLLISLDSYLNQEAAVDTSNYRLTDEETGYYIGKPQAVFYDPYNKIPRISLQFNAGILQDKHKYSLTIKKTMLAADGLALADDESETFLVDSDLYLEGAIAQAAYIGNDLIKIVASKEFALDVPNVLNSNYILTYMDGNGESQVMSPIGVTYFSENLILLRFEDLPEDAEWTLVAKEIKNKFGQTLDTREESIIVQKEDIE